LRLATFPEQTDWLSSPCPASETCCRRLESEVADVHAGEEHTMVINQLHQEKLSHAYIGLDLHKYTHTAVLLNCFSEKIAVIEIENKPSEFDRLLKEIKAKTEGLTLIFGLEDVGGNGRSLAVFLKAKGFVVKDVNAALAARYRKGDAQYKKNDEHDAQCVAEVLLHRLHKLPDANPQDLHWTLSQLVSRRNVLVKSQTTLNNQLHELLKHHYPSYNKFFSDIRGKAAMCFWHTYPSPKHLKGVSVEELSMTLCNASRNSVSTKKSKRILDIVSSDGETTEGYQDQRDFIVRSLVREMLYQKEEMAKVQEQMEKTEAMLGYQLQTMPGISIVTSCALISEIGDIHRFSNPSKLAKFAGIAPVNFSSAGKGKDKVSKQGNRTLNGIFYLLAVQQVQVSKSTKIPRNQAFFNYYQKKIQEGKTKQQALVCVMRRLVNIIYGMMKSGTTYRMPIVEVETSGKSLKKLEEVDVA